MNLVRDPHCFANASRVWRRNRGNDSSGSYGKRVGKAKRVPRLFINDIRHGKYAVFYGQMVVK